MKKLFFFVFLISCSPLNTNHDVSNQTLDFDKDLTFDEFNELIIKYAEISAYPDIDQ
jgi:hypothetical protein